MGLLTFYAYHAWLCKGQTLEGPSKAEQMNAVSIQVRPWRRDEEELNWKIQELNCLSVCHCLSHITTLCLGFTPYETFAPTPFSYLCSPVADPAKISPLFSLYRWVTVKATQSSWINSWHNTELILRLGWCFSVWVAKLVLPTTF